MALPGGSPQSRARAMQAVSLVERPRACIVHPSAQCAAAARESLNVFRLVGDRGRAAFSELLLAVEGISGGDHPDADAALQHADSEFAALGDDWGRAVAAFVRMEKLTYHADLASVRAAAADATARFRALQRWVGAVRGAVPLRLGPHPVRSPGRRRPGAAGSDRRRGRGRRLQHRAMGHRRPGSGPAGAGPGGRGGRLFHPRRHGPGSRSATTPAPSCDTYGEAVLASDRGQYAAARAAVRPGPRRFPAARGGRPDRAGVGRDRRQPTNISATPDAALDGYQRLLRHAESSGEMGLMATALEGLARAALTAHRTRPRCRVAGPGRSGPRHLRPSGHAERGGRGRGHSRGGGPSAGRNSRPAR